MLSPDELAGVCGLLLILAGLLALAGGIFKKAALLPSGVAAACLALGLVSRWADYAQAMEVPWYLAFPVFTFFESAVFLALAVLVAGFCLMRRIASRFFGAGLFGGLGALLLFLSLSAVPSGPQPFLPSLKSGWLIAHVALSFFAYAGFALAALVSLGVIFSEGGEKLLPVLRRLLVDSTLVFTVGGLVFGAIWAQHSWGRFWAWDPKETWAFITWFAYALLLHADWRGKLSARGLAAWALADFVIVVFTYFGVSLLFAGLHSYIAF